MYRSLSSNAYNRVKFLGIFQFHFVADFSLLTLRWHLYLFTTSFVFHPPIQTHLVFKPILTFLNDLLQLVQHPIRIPDLLRYTPHFRHISNLQFVTLPCQTVLSIVVTIPITTVLPYLVIILHTASWPTRKLYFWHFVTARCDNLKKCCFLFPWNYYCFQVRRNSVWNQSIAEAIACLMEAHIPKTFSCPHAKMPNFNW